MKKTLLFALLLVVGLTSCGKKEFKVRVNLKNTNESTMIYLRKIVNKEAVTVDSATFKNEMAVLTAPYDDVQMLYAIRVKDMRGAMLFFPENQDVTVVGDLENPQDVEILGGDAQTRYNEYNKGFQVFTDQMRDLYDQMDVAYANHDSVTMEALNEKGNQIMDQQADYRDNFIKSHGNDFLCHYILDESKQDFSLDDLRTFVAGFTNESIYSQDIKDYIATMERVEVGQPLVDFTLPTNEGTEVKLSDYVKGNTLVLVDFWASWCGPCRKENPNVVAAYQKYHDQGFNVLGVSVDKDENAWKKAIQDDNLPWTHVRDVNGFASDQYVIYYIPNNVLIDADGNIVAKNLRGAGLEQELAKRLN